MSIHFKKIKANTASRLRGKCYTALSCLMAFLLMGSRTVLHAEGMEGAPSVPPVEPTLVEQETPSASPVKPTPVEQETPPVPPVETILATQEMQPTPLAEPTPSAQTASGKETESKGELSPTPPEESVPASPDAKDGKSAENTADTPVSVEPSDPLSLTGWAEVDPDSLAWSVPWGTERNMLELPEVLRAEIAGDYEPGQQPDTVEVPVSWRANPAYDAETAGIYTFTARAADADLDPEEHGEPYWANLISSLPAPQRQCTVLPREEAGESDENVQWIVAIDALPEPQRDLVAVPGTPLENLSLPSSVVASVSDEAPESEASASLGTATEIPVTWESTPAYDAQSVPDAGTLPEYLFTPAFDPSYRLAESVALPEISLTLAQPMMENGGVIVQALGDTLVQDGLMYTVLSEDPGDGSLPNTVHVQANGPLTGHITIPPTVEINGIPYAVVQILAGGFQNQASITGVALPAGLSEISVSAFADCTSLASVSAPGPALEYIWDHAFEGCTSLRTFTVPVKQIRLNAFNGCTALESITLQSVTTIETDAFIGCTGLKEITFPDTITQIGADAFSGCTNLKTIHNCPAPSRIAPGAFPAGILAGAAITCDAEVAWLYRNAGSTQVKANAFAPSLSTGRDPQVIGQPFQIIVDLGCSINTPLDASMLTVTNGRVTNFSYTPYVNNAGNTTNPTRNASVTADITPASAGAVTVGINQGAFSFFGTANSATTTLSVTAIDPILDVSVTPSALLHTGGDVMVYIGVPVGYLANPEVRLDGGNGYATRGSLGSRATLIPIPPNTTTIPVTHTLSLWLNGNHVPAWDMQVTVAVKPTIQSMTVSPDSLDPAGGAVQVDISGANLVGNQLEVRLDGAAPGTEVSATQASAASLTCQLPANATNAAIQHTLSLWVNGVDSGLRQTVTVKGVPVASVDVAEVTGVSVSRARLPYEGGEVTLTVTGNNLRLAAGSGITFAVNGAGSNRVPIRSSTQANATLSISRNGTTQRKRFVLDIYLNGQDTGHSVTITVASPLDTPSGMGGATVPASSSSFSSFSGSGSSSIGLGNFADMATVLGISEDTLEYLLVYVMNEEETVVYILDSTTVEMDTEGVLSLDAQPALLKKSGFFGCTVSLRMLEELAAELAAVRPDTELGFLAITMPGKPVLRFPFHLLWKPDPDWMPETGAKDEQAPLVLLPELQAYLEEYDIPMEDLRLCLTLTPLPADGGYVVDLTVIPEESWVELGIEPLVFDTLYYPITLTLEEEEGEPLEIYHSSEDQAVPEPPVGEDADM